MVKTAGSQIDGGDDAPLVNTVDIGSRGGRPIRVQVQTIKEAVYARLLEMIQELQLPPGTHLAESDLAARLDVSKTPVREAVAMLESTGLVDLAPYRGATVRWLSALEMEEQVYLVDALELPALRRIVQRISAKDKAALGLVMESLKRARRRKDGREFRRLTAEQHRLIFVSANYPRLQQMIGMVVGPVGLRYDRVFHDNFPDAWDLQLDLMVKRYEAIVAGDAERAMEIASTGHARLLALNLSRIDDPRVARYFRPTAGTADATSTGTGLAEANDQPGGRRYSRPKRVV